MSEMPIVDGSMRKLWVLYFESSRPALFNVVERWVLNWALVNGKPLSMILAIVLNKARYKNLFRNNSTTKKDNDAKLT